ncbi:hypothetical protein [Gracilinema caldarium]|uniref:Uncharacterized protein n=1 Tax=Gracilinema caldarium (strain ATCC 51460 / DSM 7334 / H1) TaxID=744872 RepID=F8EYQ1_GRAC1|nr:hypothetical protein [Gracilinema caldarium]AEJ18628.1 hypothetical protein Spica_0464 [Gracilinema caldarium DSM 7334]
MDTRLLNYVEPIRRARGDFLYTYRGNRLVDLWKQGGRAILGHGKSHHLTGLKDTLARGVWMPVPHPGMRHLEKALQKLFPGKVLRIYRGLNRTLTVVGNFLAQQITWEDIPDPAYPGLRPAWSRFSNRITLWRPWIDTVGEVSSLRAPHLQDYHQDIIVPLLPLAWPEEVAVLILSDSVAPLFPPSELLSPVFAEYAQRAVYDLLQAIEQAPKVMLPKTQQALLNSSIWKGSSVYWYVDASFAQNDYEGLFREGLQKGFLLPPIVEDPLILPWSLSPGLDVKLAQLLSFNAEA